MSRFILSVLAALSTAATVNRSAPISQEVCDELPVPFTVPASVATDVELTEWLNAESATYCAAAGKGSSWCACFFYGLIRD